MPPFTHMILLIAAFFGADLSNTEMDLDGGYQDPDIVADFCYGYDYEVEDFHNDYSEAWYAWEGCLLRDDNGRSAAVDNSYRLGRSEAEDLVEEVWEAYTPWMRDALTDSMYFPFGDEDDWYHVVLADDWEPKLPYINTGNKKVREHCDGEETYACYVGPRLTFKTGRKLGESVFWWDDSTKHTYTTRLGTLKYSKNARIVTPRRNLFVILHELAHAIDSHQHILWDDEEPYTEELEEDERTRGHGIDFKCLLLDLYNAHGAEFTDEDLWWEDSYDELHRLCQIIAPGYAQPSTVSGS